MHDSWFAAAEFTRTRLQPIRDVEEEVHFLDHIVDFQTNSSGYLAFSRILAREQAALADLKRGLRVAE